MTKLTSMGSLLRSHSEVCHFLHRLHFAGFMHYLARSPPSFKSSGKGGFSGLEDGEMQVREGRGGVGVVGACGGLLEGGDDYAMKAQSCIQASRHRLVSDTVPCINVWCNAVYSGVEWRAMECSVLKCSLVDVLFVAFYRRRVLFNVV